MESSGARGVAVVAVAVANQVPPFAHYFQPLHQSSLTVHIRLLSLMRYALVESRLTKEALCCRSIVALVPLTVVIRKRLCPSISSVLATTYILHQV